MTATDDVTAAREAKREALRAVQQPRLDSGQRIQGEFFLRLVEEYDELDQEWTEGWLSWIYDLQYNRGVLDEKTGILPIVGYCVILDDEGQLPNDMRAALRAGATPREILEIILQSAIYAGMPRMVRAMRTYRAFMGTWGCSSCRNRSSAATPASPDRGRQAVAAARPRARSMFPPRIAAFSTSVRRGLASISPTGSTGPMSAGKSLPSRTCSAP